ncbi:unnamed protein product [Bathycoccus prasinos]
MTTQNSFVYARCGSTTSLSARRKGTTTTTTTRTRVIKASSGGDKDPLMVRTIKGEQCERPPIWMMRQAGRYMKVYQDLCKKHTTFRERSETVDLCVEISLQPYEAFKPDGVIVFSDILTPLAGMNIPFDIVKGTGPIIFNPIRDMAGVNAVTPLEPEKSVNFTGESLKVLRNELKGTDATLLGFVGAPFTLATYIVEGGTSSHYKVIKKMAFDEPAIYHALMEKLTDAVITYTRYQIDSGAQVVQIFDSWASGVVAERFLQILLAVFNQEVKQTHPDTPLILYCSGAGGFLERLQTIGADVISLDGTVDIADARARLGMEQAVQGNMDPVSLFSSKEHITQAIEETIKGAGNKKHVMNLGHGVMVGTPEENVAHFFKSVRDYRY